MANFKISSLRPTSLLDETTTIPCIYQGKTYQLSISALTDYFGTGIFSAIFSGDSIECSPNPITSSGTISFKSPGLMAVYAGSTDPDGWLICNGRELSKTNPLYSDLYGAVGDRFGTPSNSTVFKIPNMSGLSAFGLDNMGGAASGRLTANNLDGAVPTTLGSVGGNPPQTLTADQCPLQPHAHSTGSIPWVICWNNGCGCCNYGNVQNPQRDWTFDSSGFSSDRAAPGSRAWVYIDANIKPKVVGGNVSIAPATQVAATTSHPHIPPLMLFNWIIKI